MYTMSKRARNCMAKLSLIGHIIPNINLYHNATLIWGSRVTYIPHFIGTPPLSESQDVGGGDPPPAHRGVKEHHVVPHLPVEQCLVMWLYVHL